MKYPSSKKINWNTTLKFMMICLVTLYFWQASRVLHTSNHILNILNTKLLDQIKLTEAMHQDANKTINEITNEMVTSGETLNAKTSGLEKKTYQFKHKILNDLEKFRRRSNESIYIDKTYQFLNSYQETYVREKYEKAAKEVELNTNVVLPTFDSFSRLRERLFYCLVQQNNKYLMDQYKNTIAKLKYNNQESKIKLVKKPILLPWPLTEEQLKTYNDKSFTRDYPRFDPFEGFGKYIELDGRCVTW